MATEDKILGLIESLVSEFGNFTPSEFERGDGTFIENDILKKVFNLTRKQTVIGGEMLSVFNSTVIKSDLNTAREITTQTFIVGNRTIPEVINAKPEVLVDAGISTAEKVVVGAVAVVIFFTILALFLRLIVPLLKSRSPTKQKLILPSNGVIPVESKLSGYTNFGAEVTSQSSGTGSSQSQDWSQSTGSGPSTEWSDVSLSDQGKQTPTSRHSIDSDMAGKFKHSNSKLPEPAHASSMSLPTYMQDERLSSTRSSPAPKRRNNDENISVISSHSLEPLRLEQSYRDRWDDQWDPFGTLPRAGLSCHRHPSESHLSLASSSTQSSGTTFPIPPRDLVRALNQDKDRRYPSNMKMSPQVKKEKHVRLTTPNDS